MTTIEGDGMNRHMSCTTEARKQVGNDLERQRSRRPPGGWCLSVALLFTAVLLAGCGGGGGSSASSGGGAVSSAQEAVTAPTQVARIAVVAPVNSGLTAFGKGILNSVTLAVAQANAAQRVPGFRLVVQAFDDASTPLVGAAQARLVAADPQVIGVVGTYNSGVAAQVAPVLKEAGIVEISPANTDPSLTLGPNPKTPVRPYLNYFRTVVNDSVQGPALARFAFTTLGIRQVAVVTESKAVSQGLASDFSTTFTALGGTVLITEVAPAGTTDYTAILGRVAQTAPQLVFYGGEYDTGVPFREQMAAAGLAVPLMGGDGIKDDAYLQGVGPSSDGDFASSVGAPPSQLPGGTAFLEAYTAAGFTEPPTDFGPFAYDAANVLVAAAARVLAAHPTIDATARLSIISFVQDTSATGVTGALGFDRFGDTTHRLLTVYKGVGGAWVAQQTLTL